MTRSPENCYFNIVGQLFVILPASLSPTSFLRSASLFLKFCVQLNIFNPTISLGLEPAGRPASHHRTSIFIFRGSSSHNPFPISSFSARRTIPRPPPTPQAPPARTSPLRGPRNRPRGRPPPTSRPGLPAPRRRKPRTTPFGRSTSRFHTKPGGWGGEGRQ